MQGARFELAYALSNQHFDSCPQAGGIDQAIRPLPSYRLGPE